MLWIVSCDIGEPSVYTQKSGTPKDPAFIICNSDELLSRGLNQQDQNQRSQRRIDGSS